jgi:hypothetical protein
VDFDALSLVYCVVFFGKILHRKLRIEHQKPQNTTQKTKDRASKTTKYYTEN